MSHRATILNTLLVCKPITRKVVHEQSHLMIRLNQGSFKRITESKCKLMLANLVDVLRYMDA